MEEKVYQTMKKGGAVGIAVGITTLAVGLICGILMIVSGAKLLAGKSKILF